MVKGRNFKGKRTEQIKRSGEKAKIN